MQKKESYYFLQSVPGIGNITIANLLTYFVHVEDILTAPEAELKKILKQNQLNMFLERREREKYKEELKDILRSGYQYFSIEDREYPKRLLNIPDPPYGLFLKGNLPLESSFTAAVIGTRNHSSYGQNMACEYAKVLTTCGIGVISGMARGIDGIAQKCTLDNKGKTYAILGCGIKICYPPENRWLFNEIPKSGGVISEYHPDTKPQAGLFPRRNRIISGLSDILLVIEAREKSGTLITVDMALEQGKDIYALPGRVTDPLSIGCNRLIKQGAYILPEPDTFYQELQEYFNLSNNHSCRKVTEKVELTELEREIYDVLDDNPISTSVIYRHLREMERTIGEEPDISEINICLINLCMKQLAMQENGTMFRKI